MREILFRGKKFNGEWIEGDLLHVGETVCVGSNSVPVQDVDPNTVGQYTGLNDIGGTKIFEGDICEWEDDEGDKHRFRVMFRKGAFVCGHAGVDFEDWEYLSDNIALGLKVVGNVYDR